VHAMGNSRRRRFLGVAAAILVLVSGVAAVAVFWAQYHSDEANRLVGEHKFVEAYPHYVSSLKVWRWSAETHFAAGRTARRAGMFTEAETHYERFLQLRGRDQGAVAAVALERLLIPAQQGDLIQVEELLWEKVKKGAPEAPLVLEAMARGYL